MVYGESKLEEKLFRLGGKLVSVMVSVLWIASFPTRFHGSTNIRSLHAVVYVVVRNRSSPAVVMVCGGSKHNRAVQL
jgi:hypothetical protein